MGKATLPVAAALTLAGVLASTPAGAGPREPARPAAPGTTTWSPSLARGQSAGIDVRDGRARLDAAAAPRQAGVATGLLTLPEQTLPNATDEVDAALDADLPAGSTATVDVRGRRPSGTWTEWVPAQAQRVLLPEPASQVQARLVLAGSGDPVVRAVTLTAHPAARTEGGADARATPLRYSLFATREGLVGGTTANGHVITPNDHFVALPSRRALAPRDSSDYTVKVCAGNGRCAFAPVWDVGPWNIHDDYWNPGAQREMFGDLPQGTPEAQAAFRTQYRDGKDGYDRRVANPAGIDLADGVFTDDLGLHDNSTVTVDYLWTGTTRLAKVVARDAVDVLSAPASGASVVGAAAGGAGVPVTCAVAGSGSAFVQIGAGQYLPAAAVLGAGAVPPCAGSAPRPAPEVVSGAGPGAARAATPASGGAARPAGVQAAGTSTAAATATAKTGTTETAGTETAGTAATATTTAAATGTSPAPTAAQANAAGALVAAPTAAPAHPAGALVAGPASRH